MFVCCIFTCLQESVIQTEGLNNQPLESTDVISSLFSIRVILCSFIRYRLILI